MRPGRSACLCRGEEGRLAGKKGRPTPAAALVEPSSACFSGEGQHPVVRGGHRLNATPSRAATWDPWRSVQLLLVASSGVLTVWICTGVGSVSGLSWEMLRCCLPCRYNIFIMGRISISKWDLRNYSRFSRSTGSRTPRGPGKESAGECALFLDGRGERPLPGPPEAFPPREGLRSLFPGQGASFYFTSRWNEEVRAGRWVGSGHPSYNRRLSVHFVSENCGLNRKSATRDRVPCSFF